MPVLSRRRFLRAGVAFLATTAAARAGAATREQPRRVSLSCAETGESFDDVYWADGNYLPQAQARLDWLLRDFRRDKMMAIDPALIDLVATLGQYLKTRRPFLVTSAYRSPPTNAKLRAEGLPAVDGSTHTFGMAVDICAEGKPLSHLYRATVALKAGGVGTYAGAHFLHLDTGPVRVWHWRGRCACGAERSGD
jgi:uncharacterized protein YcbK (DUF882 family)